MHYRNVWCLIVVLIFTSFAHGANSSNLIEQKLRPTMRELLQELDPIPSPNPFQPLYRNDTMLKLIPILGPKMIVQLEFAYPGAVWAPLGRDAALVADILESYYLAIGQMNRVVRLNASRHSFRDRADFRKLLLSVGLIDTKRLPVKKFVVLDVTQWDLYSQSRQMVSAVYEAIDPCERSNYLPIVNAIALGYLGGESHVSRKITPNLNKLGFFSQVEVSEFGPSQILETYQDFTYPQQYHSKDLVWHQPFMQFTEDTNGNIISQPGRLSSLQFREHILWQMFEVYHLIQSKSFMDDVQEYAKNIYNFDLKHTLPISIQDLRYDLENIYSELDLLQKSNLFEYTFLPEYDSAFEYFAFRSLNLNFDIKTILNFSRILFQPVKTKFLFLHLVASKTPDEYIRLLIEIQYSNHLFQLSPFFQNTFQYFFNLDPSIKQINQAIQLIKRNDKHHVLFTSMAFEKLKTLEEYHALDKPCNNPRKKYHFYKKAEDLFFNHLKQNCPQRILN